MATQRSSNHHKRADPYYHTAAWKALRRQCIVRDGGRCVVPGCGRTERLTVDHIVSRRAGGADALSNLRTLCGQHDAAIKEMPSGRRAAGGRLQLRGCDADGEPLDPLNRWFTP